MTLDEVKKGFAMPISNPYYHKGPHEFRNREFLIITYETDLKALQEIIPEPLEIDLENGPLVKFEFIRMPDSDVFGSYTESGQVVPVLFNGKKGLYSHSMYLNAVTPLAGGREIWGFPKKFAQPSLRVDSITKDCMVGQLKYGELEVARATMGYKWKALDKDKILESLQGDNYMIKVIPDVDCTPRICELIKYNLINCTVKEAWSGPASLELFHHALAPVAKLPVKKVISAVHFVSDLSIGMGKVVKDYLK